MRDNPGGCCSSMDSEVDVESPPGQFIGGKIERYLTVLVSSFWVEVLIKQPFESFKL